MTRANEDARMARLLYKNTNTSTIITKWVLTGAIIYLNRNKNYPAFFSRWGRHELFQNGLKSCTYQVFFRCTKRWAKMTGHARKQASYCIMTYVNYLACSETTFHPSLDHQGYAFPGVVHCGFSNLWMMFSVKCFFGSQVSSSGS